jgi:hypothetical protein
MPSTRVRVGISTRPSAKRLPLESVVFVTIVV